MKKKKFSFLSTLMFVAFVFLSLSIFLQLFNGGTLKSFYLVHDGRYIYNNVSTIKCLDDNEVTIDVKQLGKLKDVTAKVYAISDKKEDFIFSYAGQEYSWNEIVAGQDFSEVLAVTVEQATEEDNAKVNFNLSIEDILLDVSYGQAVSYEVLPEHSLLCLEVTLGDESLKLSITPYIKLATS